MIKLPIRLKVLVPLIMVAVCYMLAGCSKDSGSQASGTSRTDTTTRSGGNGTDTTTHGGGGTTIPINWKYINDSLFNGGENTNVDKTTLNGAGRVGIFTSGGNYTTELVLPDGTATLDRTATDAGIQVTKFLPRGSTAYDPAIYPHYRLTDSTAATITDLYFKNAGGLGDGAFGFVGSKVPGMTDQELLHFKKTKQQALRYTF